MRDPSTFERAHVIVILCKKSCNLYLLGYDVGLEMRGCGLSLIICFVWVVKEVGDIV